MTATPAAIPAAPDRLTLAAFLGVVVLGGAPGRRRPRLHLGPLDRRPMASTYMVVMAWL